MANWATVRDLLSWAGIAGEADDPCSDMASVLGLLGASPSAPWRPLAHLGTEVLEDLFTRWVGKPDNIHWKPTPFLRAQVLEACAAAREHGLPKRQAPHAPLSERSDIASERKVKMAHV
eukprot:4594847-Amphidinium_carterae.1